MLSAALVTVLAQARLETAGAGTAAGLWVARATNYVTLALVFGFVMTAVVLLGSGASLSPAARRAMRSAAGMALLWALSCAALFVFGLSNAAARPLPGALQGEVVAQFAATKLGTAVLAQLAVALVAAVLAWRTTTAAGGAAALTTVALGAFAPAWWGHAGTKSAQVLALANDWLHVVAVGVWMGGLAALGWLALHRHDADVAVALPRFSRLAAWSLAAVLVTGVVNALLGMSAPGQLTDTTWGRLVLVKLAVLATLAWFGARQRRTVVAQATDPSRSPLGVFRRLAAAEIVVMLVGIGVAATMASGIPADAEAASRIQSIATAFGDGQINLTIDPAVSGAGNEAHLYFLDVNGLQRDDITEPSLVLESGGERVEADLFVAGPGHWTVPSLQLPAPGTYRATVAADLAGEPTIATSAVTVR